jgi:hypothetical protein
MLRDILSYGIGTLVALALVGLLVFLFVRDITQKKHSVLRTYRVVGRLRYFFEQLGEYFRQYFFAGGFMFSLGCIQALRCHQNTCPTGVTTHNKRLQCARVVEEKYLRGANYAMNMNREIDMIAHSCGVRHARELRREHVRIVQASGQSVALNMLYPYPESKAKMKVA